MSLRTYMFYLAMVVVACVVVYTLVEFICRFLLMVL